MTRLSLVRCLSAAAIFLSASANALPASAQSAPASAPSPSPAVLWQANVSVYTIQTGNPNATGAFDTSSGTDLGSRTDWSNVLVSVTRSSGTFRFGATIGEYAFPVTGQAINPTFRAGTNTDLFSFVPTAYVQYVPNEHWTFTAGKLGTLLGQEGIFTYQNVNLQRGLGWSLEPVFSRGVRATFLHGKFTGNLEINDGYYSGNHRALEGLFAWAASSNTTVQFAWLLPQAYTPPNPTAAIANKKEYDLMVTQQFGKLQLLPYYLWVSSPPAPSLGYVREEHAHAGVIIANYVFSPAWSLGTRYESVGNSSSTADLSPNADLIGYGPGSQASTFTLTPAYKTGHVTMRAEFSRVHLGGFTAGLGFGSAGIGADQNRAGFELLTQF